MWDDQIWNLLKRMHLVIPILSILGQVSYVSKSPLSIGHCNVAPYYYSNRNCNAGSGNNKGTGTGAIPIIYKTYYKVTLI
jgi:hypothetical protein